MEYKATLSISQFSDRVRVMNQMKSSELRLSPMDANNLHADITQMLAEIARLSIELQQGNAATPEINMDGGKF
jgi:hypothetical protein